MSASKLMNGAYRGGEEVFRQLFQQYGESIYSMLLSRCQDKQLAREMLRGIFAEVYEVLIGDGTVDVTAAWLKSLAEEQLMRKRLIPARAEQRLITETSQATRQQLGKEIERDPAMRALAFEVASAQVASFGAQPERQVSQPMPPQQARPQPGPRSAALAQEAYPPRRQQPQQPAAQKKRVPYAPQTGASKRNIGRIAILVGLSILIVFTLWLIVGLLMSAQIFPTADLGYQWFNANIWHVF